jgi:hypothetical protein
MFQWLKREGAAERRVAEAADAIDKSRAAIEGLIGLPHVLSRPIIQRKWANALIPSDENFARTGIDGQWRFPALHPDIQTVIKSDETGRLVLGLITGHNAFAGIRVFTQWDRFSPVSQWQVEMDEERGELTEALYRRLLGESEPAE